MRKNLTTKIGYSIIFLFFSIHLSAQNPSCIDNTCGNILANWGFADATQTVFCEGIPVELENLTNSPDIERFVWYWGDGHIDTLYNYNNPPPHIYNFPDDGTCSSGSSQTMIVSLEIFTTCTDDGQSCHFQTSGVSVEYKPRAEFMVQNMTVCQGDAVNFTDMSCFAEMWEWDFGDGGIDTIENPTYTYDNIGTYTVNLNISNSCGNDSYPMAINVVNYPDAEATYTLSPLSGLGPNSACAPATINLENNSVPGDSYTWQILNGSSVLVDSTTNELTPLEYFFSSEGTYTLSLTASNACGEDEWTETIEVLPSSNVTLANIDPQCETFIFDASEYVNYVGQIDNINWDFPGGTPTTSTEQFPVVEYTSPGTYTISISIDGCGTTTITQTVNLQIDGFPSPTLEPIPDICLSADTVLLEATPPGGIWSGNGVVGDTAFYPANASIGINTLTYTLGSGACSGSENMDVNVVDITPVVIDNPSQTVCEDGGTITLTANPPGGTWSGNITPSGDLDPAAIGAGNTEELLYEYADSNGCLSSGMAFVTIEELPIAILSQDTISFCESPQDINLPDELGVSPNPGYTDEWLGNCVTATGTFTSDCAGQGTTTLQYVVFAPNSCSDTTDITIIVTPFSPAIAMDDFSECVTAGDQVTLTATPVGGTWSGTNVSPEGIITLDNTMDGNFTYNYTVFQNSSCEDSDDVNIEFINLTGTTAPSLSYCETEGTVTLPEGNPAGGTWYYNSMDLNGELDIQAFEPGDYTLQYEVESASSSALCQAMTDAPLFIDALPVPDIIVPNDFCINESDTIFNNTSESYAAWSWDFGNGSTSTSPEPIISYTATGNYTITLIIQDTICADTFTWDVNVSSLPPSLDFDITLSAADSCETLTASFLNTSITDPNIPDIIYLWDYGNGQVDTTYSASEIPDTMDYDAFNDDMIYYVSLTALSSCGEAESIGFDSIYVKPKPMSGFGSQYEVYCSGATVQLVNSSLGNPDNTIIDLGDGSPLIYDYPEDTLNHQYWTGDESDTFFLTFISSNECGIDTIRDTITIVPVEAVAGFTVTDNGVFCVGIPICVQNLATPESDVWYDMGDGTVLFTSDTCHTYAETGIYTIMQFAQDLCGGLDTMATVVEIVLEPDIEAVAATFTCFGDSTQFASIIDNSIVNVLWDFGDGNTSTALSPAHLYSDAGDYMVTFGGNTSEGCSSDTSIMVTILPPPSPSFTFTDSVCLGDAIALSNTTQGIVTSCLWQMDDNATFTTCNTSHVFSTSGLHTVSLSTTNENGCTFLFDTVVFIRPTPVASFTYDTIGLCNPATVHFVNTSTEGNTSLWDFGDGTIPGTSETVEHIYNNAGIYNVTLISSYDGICWDTISQQIEIQLGPSSIITLNNSQGCEPFPADFQNMSTGNNLDYEWNLSDGTTSYDLDFIHTFYTDLPQEEFILDLIVRDSVNTCADTSSVVITVFDSLQLSLLPTDNLCTGESTGSIISIVGGGMANYQYNWSDQTNGISISNLSAGSYSLTVVDANGCMETEETTIVNPDPLMLSLEELRNATCAGNTDGFIDVNAAGGTTNTGNEYTYDWNVPNSNPNTDLLSNLEGGFYTVTVTDENGCTILGEYEIESDYELELMAMVEGITCEGDADGSITIEAIENGIPGFSAMLDGPSTATIISELGYMEFNNLLPGNYELTIADSNQCMITEQLNVATWQNPYVEIFSDDAIFRCQNLGLVALGTASGSPDQISYVWFPDVAINCLDCDSVIVSPEIDITYEVTLTDVHGCTASHEKEILVSEDRTFYLPNTFTPNGDGENDIFRVRVGEHQEYLLVEVSHFTVLDRWGNVLYNAPVHHPFFEPNVGWKGLIDGVEAPSGMYTYWVEYVYCDGKKEIEKGLIQLIR